MKIIQNVALKLIREQIKVSELEQNNNDRTIFICGSKGVGKSTVINKYLEHDDTMKPTLALEYYFGRHSTPSKENQKQVLNFWELGSFEKSEELIYVPIKTHGTHNFICIVMLDLSKPENLLIDLKGLYTKLKVAANKLKSQLDRKNVKNSHNLGSDSDKKTSQFMPFPIVLVGGKYDDFTNFDPRIKALTGRCLRAFAHLIGGALLYYTNKNPNMSKILRDTINHLVFDSPKYPFRPNHTDYNNGLSIWFGFDSWDQINDGYPLTFEQIENLFTEELPQYAICKKQYASLSDPTNDSGFRETFIDLIRTQKNEELQSMSKYVKITENF